MPHCWKSHVTAHYYDISPSCFPEETSGMTLIQECKCVVLLSQAHNFTENIATNLVDIKNEPNFKKMSSAKFSVAQKGKEIGGNCHQKCINYIKYEFLVHNQMIGP